MKTIAYLQNDFPTKFGLPRQSGLVETLASRVVFEPEYRDPEALRGIEGFSHLWLIWKPDRAEAEGFHPTVRPPRLGGNTRVGVFASRSPFRPNPIGLSCVRLERVCDEGKLGRVLYVAGADMADGTPIYDIKPYLAFADAHPDARDGFAGERLSYSLGVEFPPALLEQLPEDRRETLVAVLSQDPRPAYHDDPGRIYGFSYAGFEVRFRVDGQVLIVCAVEPPEG